MCNIYRANLADRVGTFFSLNDERQVNEHLLDGAVESTVWDGVQAGLLTTFDPVDGTSKKSAGGTQCDHKSTLVGSLRYVLGDQEPEKYSVLNQQEEQPDLLIKHLQGVLQRQYGVQNLGKWSTLACT